MCHKLSRLALLFFPLAIGCADDGMDLGEIATVTGSVSLDGKPLPEGIVTFNCPATGQVATGTIQPDGSYMMKLRGKQGLPLGEYKVSVRPPLARSQEHLRRSSLPKPPERKPSVEIPEKYRFETSSGLSASVQSGENSFDFQLE